MAIGAVAGAARAQSVPGESPVAVDVGVARIQQAGTAPLLAPSVGASWRVRGARGGVGAAGVAAAGDGRVAAEVALDGARTFGSLRAPRDVTIEVRGVRVPNTPWAAQLLAGLRQQALWGRSGGWIAAQGGVVRQVGVAWPSATAEVGAWWAAGAAGRVAVAATAATARVEERGLVAAGLDAYGPSRVATGDVVASYARNVGRLETNAWLGVRAFAPGGLRALPPDADDAALPGAPLRWRGLAAVAATAWLAPSVGITASAGVLPNDPVRGLPAARHVLLAVRVRPWARSWARPTAPSDPGRRRAASPTGDRGPELRVDDGAGASGDAGSRVVRVVAPGAVRVELRADATGWRAVALVRDAGGQWSLPLALGSGTHRVLVRVDAGPWRPPANLPAVDDDLGGTVGLLVVP